MGWQQRAARAPTHHATHHVRHERKLAVKLTENGQLTWWGFTIIGLLVIGCILLGTHFYIRSQVGKPSRTIEQLKAKDRLGLDQTEPKVLEPIHQSDNANGSETNNPVQPPQTEEEPPRIQLPEGAEEAFAQCKPPPPRPHGLRRAVFV